ncbi:MAG: YggS family pyridoxal phosphate-dependent enzyme [Caldilineaceae bacterium]
MIGKWTPTDYTAGQIAANLESVRRRMAAAAIRAGRDPRDVLLVAVSKTQPMPMIEAAVAAGQRDFGENRLEELWPKVEAARDAHLEVTWHFIGTIQSRKTEATVGPWALIHSVDRAKIAQRLSRDAAKAGQVLRVLLEVNVSGEESKHGFVPAELLAAAPELAALPGIRVAGLMTMAPLVDDPEAARPVFRALRELRDNLMVRCPQAEWRHLSMGMTNDFEVAIEEGATIVRVGSAIFGTRT